MTFYTELTLPVSHAQVLIKEMTMLQFNALQKYLLEGNNSNIEMCMMQLINECCINVPETLCNIDLFAILCKLRSISLGDEISFVINEANIKCSLEFILQRISNMDFNIKHTINYQGISIELRMPHMLNIQEFTDVVGDVIYAVDGCQCNQQQKQQIQHLMAVNVLNDIIEFIKKGFESMQQHWFIEPNEALEIPGININAFNNSIIEILKFIFKDDLMNSYNVKYILASKLHIAPSVADAMSPAECRIYISLLNEDIARQNKQLQDQNNNSKYPI